MDAKTLTDAIEQRIGDAVGNGKVFRDSAFVRDPRVPDNCVAFLVGGTWQVWRLVGGDFVHEPALDFTDDDGEG